MTGKGGLLKGLLTNAIIDLCRREAFYAQELRIEGTVCLVSDKTSVVIAQIAEQIGDDTGDAGVSQKLPVIDLEGNSAVSVGIKGTGSADAFTVDSYNSTTEDAILADCQTVAECASTSVLEKDKLKGKYSCPFCEKRFRFKQLLKRHMHIHLLSKRRFPKSYSLVASSAVCKDKAETSKEKQYSKESNTSQLSFLAVTGKVEDGGSAEDRYQKNVNKTCTPVKERSESVHEKPGEVTSSPLIATNITQPTPTLSSEGLIGLQGQLPYHFSPHSLASPGGSTIPDDSLQMHLQLQQQAYSLGLMVHQLTSAVPVFPLSSPTYTSPQHGAGFESLLTSTQASVKPADPVRPFERTLDGKFQCPYCEKSYNFKHTLKDHINKHLGKRPHVCRHCGDSFTHLASLCAHIKRRHKTEMPQDFRCDLCQENFMNYQSLKQHYTWRHKGKKFPLKYTGKQDVPAAGCPETVAPASGAKKKGQTSAFPEGFALPYSLCSTTLPSPVYTEAPSVSMPTLLDCIDTGSKDPNSASTTTRGTTGMGPKLPHEAAGETDTLSDNTSPTVTEYFNDIDVATESGNFKFQCRLCSSMFKVRDSLAEHLSTHFGNTPHHVCSLCGDRFAHHSSLHNHMRSRHPPLAQQENDDHLKRYCVTCDKRFRFPHEAERHLKHNPGHIVSTG